MKEPIKCPACGIDNPRNRLTCQVCGERLIPNPTKLREKGEKKSPKKGDTPQESIKLKSTEIPTNQTPSPLTLEVESPPPTIKLKRPRKKRAKTTKEPTPVFFVLQNGHLSAVHITWGVMKPIKRKELSVTERNVLSVWNRTKDLIRNN